MTPDDVHFLHSTSEVLAADAQRPAADRRVCASARALLGQSCALSDLEKSLGSVQVYLDADDALPPGDASKAKPEHKAAVVSRRDLLLTARDAQGLRVAFGLARLHASPTWARKLSAGDQTRLGGLLPATAQYATARAILGVSTS